MSIMPNCLPYVIVPFAFKYFFFFKPAEKKIEVIRDFNKTHKFIALYSGWSKLTWGKMWIWVCFFKQFCIYIFGHVYDFFVLHSYKNHYYHISEQYYVLMSWLFNSMQFLYFLTCPVFDRTYLKKHIFNFVQFLFAITSKY